jgi:hypothetical protein
MYLSCSQEQLNPHGNAFMAFSISVSEPELRPLLAEPRVSIPEHGLSNLSKKGV